MGVDAYYDGQFLQVPARMPWAPQGACYKTDPNIFYPGTHNSLDPARALCAACPVLAECRDWAIRNERWGFWGGLTEKERARIRGRESKPINCVICDREFVVRMASPKVMCSEKCREEKRKRVRQSVYIKKMSAA